MKKEHIEILKEKIKDFPTSPGVYLMKDLQEKILYVGKAKNLKNRVRSYFVQSQDLSAKTQVLVNHIRLIDYITTTTEVEAFLLEASLIKKHRPKYNIRLKDDKAYPYIKVSLQDDFPRFYLARKVKKDGSLYFGPYSRGAVVHGTIKFLNATFHIRDCKDSVLKTRKRPCMTYQIGRCLAPCVGYIEKADYHQDIQNALKFLRGQSKDVLSDLEIRMKEAATHERFELAAKLRDSIKAISAIQEKQSVLDSYSDKDQDVIGYHSDESGTFIETLHLRAGRLIGHRGQFFPLLNFSSPDEDPRDWLVSFMNQYYVDNMIPDEILLPIDLGHDLIHLMKAVLKERSDKEILIRFPTNEKGQNLLQIAQKNAETHFHEHLNKSQQKQKGLEIIQKKLQLPKLPLRIECYDISNFQGSDTVASQVVFEDGVPNKDQYRRYKLRTIEGPDDYSSMKEVFQRRFKHQEYDEPDLIVIDGGKGQLNTVTRLMNELGLEHIPIVGLAKSRVESDFQKTEIQQTEERFFLPGRQNPVLFAPGEALYILTGIRDEAHRFAITYHRKLLEATSLSSVLDYIVGLGEKRKKTLLKKYNSIDEIKAASLEELSQLPTFNRILAERIHIQLQELEDSSPEDKDPDISK